jgi:16S rRNA processing protein RimM
MQDNQLSHIGYFSKTHGVKGHLILKEAHEFLYEGLKVFFIDMPVGRAPFFIKYLKPSNKGLIVGLEDIDSVEKAGSVLNRKVYVDASLLVEEDNFTWVDFELIDKHHGSLGMILEENDNGHQVLLTLLFKGKEIILPLVDEFIEKVDEKAKKIFYNAPEGLIDIYLGESGE